MTGKIYTKKDFENKLLSIREKLASLEHKQWSHWEEYREKASGEMHKVEDIPNTHVWKRQRKTPYSKLTEKEKNSDRNWADKVLNLLRKEFKELLYFAEDKQ